MFLRTTTLTTTTTTEITTPTTTTTSTTTTTQMPTTQMPIITIQEEIITTTPMIIEETTQLPTTEEMLTTQELTTPTTESLPTTEILTTTSIAPTTTTPTPFIYATKFLAGEEAMEMEDSRTSYHPQTLFMVTLVTTTTIAPPEWVASLEERVISVEDNAQKVVDDTLLMASKPSSNEPTPPQSRERSRSEEQSQSAEQTKSRESSDSNDSARPRNHASEISVEYSNFQDGKKPSDENEDDEGQTLSIRKTKVVTTIEKRKYIGPCGSACSYSGKFDKKYKKEI